MKREIKFKAWNPQKQEWFIPMVISFDNIHEDAEGIKIYLCWRQSTQDSNSGKWERCKIVEYTSLLDKNGKEIYEGDIVKALYPPTYSNNIYKIRWWNDGFVCYRDVMSKVKFEIFGVFSNESIEVIGNIHKNPELIK